MNNKKSKERLRAKKLAQMVVQRAKNQTKTQKNKNEKEWYKMSTKLEISKNKLERLKREYQVASDKTTEEFKKIPFGQPNIIGRPDIYKTGKRYAEKARKLDNEIEKQEMLIDKLEKVEKFKDENELLKDVHVKGKSGYATVGAKTSVNNLDYFKQQLKELEEQNERAKAYNKTKPTIKMETVGAKITKLKHKIAMLEDMKEKSESQIISQQAQQLIDSGLVNQWKKKPIYYFVKGLKKVALELDSDGNFQESLRYRAWTDEDKQYIKELLSREN